MNHHQRSLSALLTLLLAPSCGDDSTATGFTGGTAQATTSGSTAPPTGTDADDTDTDTTVVSTSTDESSTTSQAGTEPVGETIEATSTGDSSTGDSSTGGSSTTDTGSGTTDGESGTTDADSSTGARDDDTIYEIQDGTIAEASPVAVERVIVSAVAPDLGGLFVQEPDGGKYSGIWVAVGDGQDIAALAIGDEVDVLGVAAEIGSRTAIDASAGGVTPTGVQGLVVEPEPLLTEALTTPALAEPWESVLIRISGAPLSVAGIIDAGEFKLVDADVALVVDDFLFDVPADVVAFPGFDAGATFTQIAGVLNVDGDFDGYKLAPRRPDDLVGYQQP